jgi:alpha-galactosidase
MFVSSKISLGSALLSTLALASSACTTWNGSSAGGGGSAGALSSAGGATAAGAPSSAGAASSAAGDTTYGGVPNSASALLAPTPPMGWNSWNKFQSAVSETVIKQIADAMVSSGMTDVGYQYLVIDDTWQAAARDASGNLQADPTRFANGIKALADYVHADGLKLGIYSDRGTATCAGKPGSGGFETQDATTFASWGVDYLKYDNCSAADGTMQQDYTAMGSALQATGRPIVFSICAWWYYPWMASVGQLWRTTTDISDNWSTDIHGVISLIDKNGEDVARFGYFDATIPDSAAYSPGLAAAAAPGAWNDPDMLEVGNGGMTDTEYRSHFSLWAMMAAPLIAGNDLRSMTQATQDILTNPDVIAVDQDPLGKQGKPISPSTTLEVWSRPLSGTATYAVVLFNRTDTAADISVQFGDLGITSGVASARDLWSHTDLGQMSGGYTANVPSHGVVMLKVVGGS